MDDMVSAFGFWMKFLLFVPGFRLKVITFLSIPVIHSFIHSLLYLHIDVKYLNNIPQIRTKQVQKKTWSAVTARHTFDLFVLYELGWTGIWLL
jgi:NADH:ubiquinone oxidoreductase subunit 2 (subunit N)